MNLLNLYKNDKRYNIKIELSNKIEYKKASDNGFKIDLMNVNIEVKNKNGLIVYNDVFVSKYENIQDFKRDNGFRVFNNLKLVRA